MESKIIITRTIDDLKIACKLHNAKYTQGNKYLSWWKVILGVLLGYLAFKGLNQIDNFLLACILITWGGVPLWNRYNAAQIVLKINPDALNEESLIITEEELQSHTNGCVTIIQWFAFFDAAISEQMILFYTNRASFFALPKRFFSEEEYIFLKNKAKEIIAKNKSNKQGRYRDSKY